MKKITILLSSIMAFNLYAEVNTADLATPEEKVESQEINIEGQYKVKEEAPAQVVVAEKKEVRKPLSPSERMRLRREQLEIRNRIMVEKKMEQIRWQQEVALAKKLEESMNKTIQAIDIK